MKDLDINPKNYHKNPRQITEKQFLELKQWLEELGDLSGIVHDLNSNELIGGNQRSRVLMKDDYEVTLTKKYAKPTSTGTVAVGYITWKGEMYNYRQVKWTPKQCEKANIIANKGGGTWDTDVLANEFELEDLANWGFEEWELSFANTEEPEEEEQEEKKGTGYVIKSEIIFDDEAQKENFEKFLRFLKKKYKNEETIAARLDNHVREFI